MESSHTNINSIFQITCFKFKTIICICRDTSTGKRSFLLIKSQIITILRESHLTNSESLRQLNLRKNLGMRRSTTRENNTADIKKIIFRRPTRSVGQLYVQEARRLHILIVNNVRKEINALSMDKQLNYENIIIWFQQDTHLPVYMR